MGATKRNAVRPGARLVTEVAPQNYDVDITVTEPETGVFYVSVNPEHLPLNGTPANTITWKLRGNIGAKFHSESDVQFPSARGQERFQIKMPPNQTERIVGTVIGPEEDQTIYTYYFTVHIGDVSVRVDPEVDNPPPPPR
jgi:hypothetical protein